MTDYTELVKALRWNGTEYKGSTMDEEDKQMYLDAAAAIEDLRKVNRELRELYEDAVRKLPKRGEWITKGQDILCSVCGEESACNWWGASKFSNYCPNCGAKMIGEQNVE